MTHRLVLVSVLALLLSAASCRQGDPPASPSPAAAPAAPAPEALPPAGPEAAAANNAFAVDLFKKLVAEAKGGNVFFSPFSLESALGMTAAGARGATADEMAAVLHLAAAGPDPHAALAGLARALTGAKLEGGELKVANALWGQRGFGFQKAFLELVSSRYGGGLREVDFVKATEEARLAINAWVAEITAGRIKDLLAPGDVTAATALVLTNAIYFKGLWAAKFDPAATRPGNFKLASGQVAQVPLMSQSSKLGYAEPRPGLQLLELPYQGGELSMVVLLPAGDAAGLAASLDAATLAGWLASLDASEKVDVSLPKWKLESRSDLGPVLASLGMKTAFGAGADFSGMGGAQGDLSISKVIHQANIEVDEEGTVAAAATAVIMRKALSEYRAFHADRPFVYLLRHRPSGAILFLGLLSDPRPAG
ncbi:MAG TPA: serpin family protein [Myxococcota bacterium]|nr:serpin family protein [Myxococcota bacterium]HRY93133.1 serpin family protein [Myxococcota bacterium]